MVDPDKNNGVVKPLDQEMGNGGGGGGFLIPKIL